MTLIWSATGSYLPVLLLLLLLSAFFSGSEAAYFSLTQSQRRQLAKGSPTARVAHRLMNRSERLLMGILLWNLAINLTFFSLISRVSLALEASSTGASRSSAAILIFSALLAVIVFGEFMPKSIAVMYPIAIARLVAFPLSLSIRLVDVVLPTIKFVNEASRRLLWPGLKPEPYLALADLDRAIELSTDDAQLFEQEQQALRNIISLSEIRIDQWMRPRTQYRVFTPPVSLEQLGGEKTPSGYMLITDADGGELVSAVDLHALLPDQTDTLAMRRQPLVVVPWCASMADALGRLRQAGRKVAVVVNELGETVGILTLEDIFESILQLDNFRSKRELAKSDVRQEAPGVWLATGMTKLRHLERIIRRRLSISNSLTVGGVVQEQLKRLPEQGDVCTVNELRFEVIEAGIRGEILVRITETESSDGDAD